MTGALLYEGAKVGDVVKVEAEFHVDGIEITEVFTPKQKKERTDLLELKSRPLREDELVTTQRVSRDERRGGRGGGRSRDDRGDRGRRGEGRGGQSRGERRPRPEAEPSRPKPKRLRPRRTHRDALLAEVGDEHRPIVEQVMKDGMPGVRAAIDRQNAEAKEAGKPEIEAAPILAIAEKNLSKARLADWRDRADAALANVADLDLRDLRSVVVAGNDVARDQESRGVAETLKNSLNERVESDHSSWLEDLESAIGDGRVVRALRLSSRPVKAGAPLPPELASTLAGQASEALAPDIGQERWATVLDALAFSPVRGAVTPLGVPPEPKAELLDAVKRLSDRIPTIAGLFGIDPATVPKSARRRRGPRRDGAKGGQGERGEAKNKNEANKPEAKSDAPNKNKAKKDEDKKGDAAERPATEAPTTDAPAAEESATETPVVEAPAPEAPAAEEATPEAPVAEAAVTEAPAAQEAAPEAPAAEEAPEAPEAPAAEEAPAGEEPA